MMINRLPDEILQQIFLLVSPEDVILNLQCISKRFYRLANEPLLWRQYCRTYFKYWDSNHLIRQKYAGNVEDVDWKRLYHYRQNVDLQTTNALECILAAQSKRIEQFERIINLGYDTKDTLLRHCKTDDTAEDVLSRRFYSSAALNYLHRSKALEEWWRMSRGERVPLERALGAFDMFILQEEYGDLQEVSDILDDLVKSLRSDKPDLDYLPPRQKAIAALQFLRRRSLTGIASKHQLCDLHNSNVGMALKDPNHPSLPFVNVAIFCCVAQRLGLDAYYFGFPHHILAVVYPNINRMTPEEDSTLLTPMFLDPHRSDIEVPMENLKAQLTAWGINNEDFHQFLGELSTRNTVLHTSRNILATVHEFRRLHGNTENSRYRVFRPSANPFVDIDNAFYSALWANFFLCTTPSRLDINQPTQFLSPILEQFERLYPMDANLIERFVCPLLGSISTVEHWQLFEALRVVRARDSMPRQVRSRRNSKIHGCIKYKIGQVFKHRRYSYTAVIIGWSIECNMPHDQMMHSQLDTLNEGQHQSFYHALAEDTSTWYVAEENIEVIEPNVPTSLMTLAGRYFKRWDIKTHSFVSNIKDEYPDD